MILKRYCIYFCFVVLILLFFSGKCIADPSITSIEFEDLFISDNQVTLFGSSFGNGPTILIFDDFSRGKQGDPLDLSATIGSWYSVSQSAEFIDDGKGNIAAMLIDDSSMRQIYVRFDPVTEAFLSYRVQIPDGYNFPTTDDDVDFPDGSQWKLTWLYDHATGVGTDSDKNDMCLPTYPYGEFTISGNSGVPHAVGSSWPHFDVGGTDTRKTSTRWFSFGDWNRFSVYLKGGTPDPTSDPGTIWAQGMSEEFGQHQFGPAARILHGGWGYWTRLNVPGWNRGGGTNVRAIYDDIYFAIGENAQARVEIGNAPTYNSSTILTIATPDYWSNNQIRVTLREVPFKLGDNVYLFVVDSDGNPSTGYGPVTFGYELDASYGSSGGGGGCTLNHKAEFNLFWVMLIIALVIFFKKNFSKSRINSKR